MLKKTSIILVKYCCLFSFTLLISAAFIMGTGVTQAFAAKKADTQKSIAGLVDINNATQKELEDIKGVGAATAKKIIAGRPYKSVDELSKTGIKPKVIDAMKPFVTVGNAQAVPVKETATKAVTKATAPVSAAPTDRNRDITKKTNATAIDHFHAGLVNSFSMNTMTTPMAPVLSVVICFNESWNCLKPSRLAIDYSLGPNSVIDGKYSIISDHIDGKIFHLL